MSQPQYEFEKDIPQSFNYFDIVAMQDRLAAIFNRPINAFPAFGKSAKALKEMGDHQGPMQFVIPLELYGLLIGSNFQPMRADIRARPYLALSTVTQLFVVMDRDVVEIANDRPIILNYSSL